MLIPALRAAGGAFPVVTQADGMQRNAGPLGHSRRHPEHVAGERRERVIDELAGSGARERLVGSRGVRARGRLSARRILRGLGHGCRVAMLPAKVRVDVLVVREIANRPVVSVELAVVHVTHKNCARRSNDVQGR